MKKYPFRSKNDFSNEKFYYFSPKFNLNRKTTFGEHITKFHGVNNIFSNFIFYFFKSSNKQEITLSLKNRVNILISSNEEVLSDSFRNNVLTQGSVSFFNGAKWETFKSTIPTQHEFTCFSEQGKFYIFKTNIQYFAA